MKFKVQKTENCFADAQTYAYETPLAMTEEALAAFARFGALEIKRNYRRPCYFLRGGGVEMKGLLGGSRYKVSYPEADWQARKADFEAFLEAMRYDG